MKAYIKLVLLLIAVCVMTACGPVKDSVDGGGQTIVIDESPVSGEKTEQQTKKLEVDETLLEKCNSLPKPDFGKGRPVDVNEVKRQETLIYVRCALTHNALVDFLIDKLGIVPVDMAEPKR